MNDLFLSDFQDCCVGLLSPLVTIRTKNANKLSEFLCNQNLLEALNKGTTFTWDCAVYYMNAFLLKEAEKLQEDEQKKTVRGSTYLKKTSYGELLLDFVKLANKDEIRLEISKLIDYIETCFQSKCISKRFSKTYILLLRDRILSEKRYWSKMTPDDWLRLYNILKALVKKPIIDSEEVYYVESLYLVIKFGPLHGFPVTLLRNEFDFIEKLCLKLSEYEKTVHEKVLQLLIEFCRHTAADCRMACCKLGESTFSHVRALYHTNSLDRVKLLVFEYFLLQMKLHHPRGAVQGSPLALAINWDSWLRNVYSLYNILCVEVDKHLCTKTKSYGLLVIENEYKMVHRTFIDLFVEVYRQKLTIRNTSTVEFFSGPGISDKNANKKRKLDDDDVKSIIQIDRIKNDWPWINIITHLLKQYPQFITSTEFTDLLQMLSDIQVECKDANMRYHMYECLIALADVQKHMFHIFADVTTFESLWSVIWESTLRAVGLNQNESQTNILLQKLITLHYKLRQSSEVFRAYFSGVLKISVHSLSTLEVACCYCPLPDTTPRFPGHKVEPAKLTLLKLLLSKENFGAVSRYEIFARVCVSLILKKYPRCNKIMQEENGDDYDDIERMYEMTCIDGELLVNEIREKIVNKPLNSYVVEMDLFDQLIALLVDIQNDAEYSGSAVFKLIDVIVLCFNVISYLLYFNVIKENELEEFILYRNMLEAMSLLVHPINSICAKTLKAPSSSQVAELTEYMELFEMFFKINIQPEFTYKLREIVPVDLLRPLFNLAHNENTDENDYTKLRLLALKVISQYCCVLGMKKMTDNQSLALEALIPDNFDAHLNIHFNLAMTFLSYLRHYELGTLNEQLLRCSAAFIANILQVHSNSHDILLQILGVIRDLYPHIVLTNSEELRLESVNLLYDFHKNRDNFSVATLTAVIDCFGVLTKLDTTFSWAKLDDKHISEVLLEFILSNYQKIRLTAVRNLAFSFQRPFVPEQKIIFEKINEACDKMFTIKNVESVDMIEERKIDETVTRTASVMHTYGTIIATSGLWRRKALLALLNISHRKQLNIDTFRKTVKKVARYLKFNDTLEFLKNYMGSLLEEWYRMVKSLDEFPYSIFDCASKKEFYTICMHFIVPLLAQEENFQGLIKIASCVDMNVKDIVANCFSKIISKCFLFFAKLPMLSPEDNENIKKIYQNLLNLLSEETVDKYLLNKIDEIIVSLIKFVFDLDYFQEVLFDSEIILLEPESIHYSVEVMRNVLVCLQEKVLNGQLLMSYCIEKYPSFIQKILLNLIVEISNATVLEDKLINFCHYTIIINETLPFLKMENPMQVFLVNYIICSLINIINNEKESFIELAIATCKYLKQTLQQIMSDCSELIENLLVRITSTLVPIARHTTKIGDSCMDLLNYLIVDNAYVLLKAVELLDPFPAEERFENLVNVHYRIKYGNDMLSLEQAIRLFLNTGKGAGNFSCRAEGLKHLKKHLAEKKYELKELYQKLSEMRGFAEDAQDSLLHQFICVLVKLTRSENSEVRLQALRCLGEIGPADLTTLMLQTDLSNLDFKCTHFELITGRILPVFVQYIVDPNVEVMKATSTALYKVLQSKEGRGVIASKRDFGSGVIDERNLLPFITSVKCSSASVLQIDEQHFKDHINNDNLWCPSVCCAHNEWITNLVCALLATISDKCYLPSLIPVCKAKAQFAELLLPLLISVLLYTASKTCVDIICRKINYFFKKHWNLTTQDNSGRSFLIPLTRTSVQCMLDVVHFYRIQRSKIAVKKNISELQVNYLHVARAAQFCFAHFSVLLYIELWSREELEKINLKGYEPFATDITELDIIYQEQDEHTRNTLHMMLKNAYAAIGETDALHGCSLSEFFSNEYCKDLGALELLQYYDMQISHGTTSSTSQLMDSLKNCSLYQLPLICKAETNNSQYECLWRLGQWNEKVPNVEFENMHHAYEKLRYFSLKGLHDGDRGMFVKALENARRCVLDDLKCSSLESCKTLYGSLCKLQSLQELEDFGNAASSSDVINVIQKWKLQDTINTNEFFYMEPIKAQRIVILKNCLSIYSNEAINNCLIDSYLELAIMGRQENNFNISRRALGDLHYFSDITQDIKFKIVFEEAQLNWESGNKHIGKQMLRQLLNSDIKDIRLKASVLKLYGTWMADASSQSSQVIIRSYLQKSIQVLENNGGTNDIFDTYLILAKFADREYQHVLSYTKSTGFQRTIQNIERTKQKVDVIKRKQKVNEDEKRAQIILDKQSRLDENKINNTYQEKDAFLQLAVEYYLRNLKSCDLNNMSVFRVISLFLENRTNTKLQSLMDQYVHQIPTYKYVTILPQLVPHITSKSDDKFGVLITSIVLKCAKEHPHHTLPLILALINGNKDRDYSNSTTITDTNETRLNGAKQLVGHLVTADKSMKELIENMMKVADALIELAYIKTQNCEVTKSSKIRQLKNVENVLLPTVTIPVNRSGNYDNIIGIKAFKYKYTAVEGINAPKRILCQGTDGIWRAQLVKGKDDLRQDAVMQQVFTIMNSFLTSNKQTKKLLIRTYKIVPLSMRSGILEWVENSMPIGDYLVGNENTGAHSLYAKPTHYSSAVCRRKLKSVAKVSNEDKLLVFMDICKNFPPVFHKFFETSFPQPTVWYERRRAYMHSVATSSMCGYILGIGDRHVRNILIDKATAEVVHIDFGIAFDQGHVLPTPETVPFRLTRDIVDGMGVSGVEGVFRKSCEKTMEVLRQNSQTIITILEVLLYDPLYSWAVTPAEAYNRQQEETVDGNISTVSYIEDDAVPSNISAERALLRLKEKLQGTEDGSATSVEGQVGKLIQQARNPENLCRLFNGWQAYL